MTDKQFQKELDKLAKVNINYKVQLMKVEAEIEKRFGFLPSDVDLDVFIDNFHVGTGYMTVQQVTEECNSKTTEK